MITNLYECMTQLAEARTIHKGVVKVDWRSKK
jgi:hypothetical protein